jgi:polar amino acid transport system permease protein
MHHGRGGGQPLPRPPGARSTRRATRLRRRSNRIAARRGLHRCAVVLAVVVLVPLAPGWEAVQRSFFNGEVFARTFPGCWMPSCST